MKVERYTAPTMDEALSKVKADLGQDAVILKTRKVSSQGRSSSGGNGRGTSKSMKRAFWGKNEQIEVTAALADKEPIQTERRAREPAGFQKDVSSGSAFRSKLSEAYDNESNGESSVEKDIRSVLQSETKILREQFAAQIETISESIEDISHQIKYADVSRLSDGSDAAHIFSGLLKNGVDEKIVRSLLRKVKKDLEEQPWDASSVRGAVLERTKEMIKIPNFLQKTGMKILFVGPNGSGKTTALSKLAIQYKTDKAKDIAIVSADTYRAGALGQIEGLAKIINVPASAVYSPFEMEGALERFKDKDLVLIDTPGVSKNSSELLDELAGFVQKIDPHEVHLVLSASDKPEDSLAFFQKFKPLGVDRILLTRLYETENPGTILNLIDGVKKPLSYTISEPSITGEIQRADPVQLAELIMK